MAIDLSNRPFPLVSHSLSMCFARLFSTLFAYEVYQMAAVDGLRYRANDAMRKVTKAAIRDARKKEIAREIINSESLKVLFSCFA